MIYFFLPKNQAILHSRSASYLRNYNTVPDKVEYGSPVYLTVNGRGKYTIPCLYKNRIMFLRPQQQVLRTMLNSYQKTLFPDF